MRSRPAVWILVAALRAAPSASAQTLAVEDCIARALAHAPARGVSEAGVDAAAAHVEEARAAYLPSLSAHAEYGRAKGYDEAVTNGGSTQAVARLESTIFDGGTRRLTLDASRARLRSARARSAQDRADLELAVRTAYATALAARAELAIGREAEAALRGYARMLGNQDRAGAATENDVLRAELAVRSQAETKRASEGTLDSARAELASLAGVEVPAAALVEYAPPPAVQTDDDLEAAPSIVDAREAADAAERDASSIGAERFGKATLTADGGAIGVGGADTLEHRGGAQFLLGLDVPLFDGGVRARKIDAARAEERAARATLLEARRKLRLQIDEGRAELRRAEVDGAAAREASALAERNFHLSEARHLGGGNVRLLEVLDAFTQWSALRLSAVHADLALRLARARIDAALGKVTP